MKLKLATGTLVFLTLLSNAYAESCPTVSLTTSSGAKDGKFTAARIKDGGTANSVVVCQLEGEGDLGISVAQRPEAPVTGTGPNWKNNECSVTDGDASKCPYKR